MYAISTKGLNNRTIFFKNPSYSSWDLTDSVIDATLFETEEAAEDMKKTLDHAVGGTYWDYDDVIPFPKVYKLTELEELFVLLEEDE
jgi:hypothetical protein